MAQLQYLRLPLGEERRRHVGHRNRRDVLVEWVFRSIQSDGTWRDRELTTSVADNVGIVAQRRHSETASAPDAP